MRVPLASWTLGVDVRAFLTAHTSLEPLFLANTVGFLLGAAAGFRGYGGAAVEKRPPTTPALKERKFLSEANWFCASLGHFCRSNKTVLLCTRNTA